jgi:hypothetical protein
MEGGLGRDGEVGDWMVRDRMSNASGFCTCGASAPEGTSIIQRPLLSMALVTIPLARDLAMPSQVGGVAVHSQTTAWKKKEKRYTAATIRGRITESYCSHEPTLLVHGQKNRRRDSN